MFASALNIDTYDAVLSFHSNISCTRNIIHLYFPSNVSNIVVHDIFFTDEDKPEYFVKTVFSTSKRHHGGHGGHGHGHSSTHTHISHSTNFAHFAATSRIRAVASFIPVLTHHPAQINQVETVEMLNVTSTDVDEFQIMNVLATTGTNLVVNVTMWSENPVFLSTYVQSMCEEGDVALLPAFVFLSVFLFLVCMICSDSKTSSRKLY